MMIRPLSEVFGELTDPRAEQGKRYELDVLLTLVFVAVLSGANGLREISRWLEAQRWELSRRIGLRGGRVPSYGAVRGILVRLDAEELEARLSAWAQGVVQARSGEAWPGVAVDGKTIRGSQGEDHPAALHLLSAFSHQMQVVLGQRAVPDHTNEIPAARDLLEQLTLEGWLVTLDAMHTQRETAELIVEKGGPI